MDKEHKSKKRIKIKLSIKIISIVLLLSVIIFTSHSYFQINKYKSELTNSFVNKAKSVAYSLDTSIEDRNDLDNEERMQSIIHKNIWLDADIIGIRLNTLQEGELITKVSDNINLVGTIPDEDNQESYLNHKLLIKEIFIDNDHFLRVITPVHISGKEIGTFQIDFTMENIERIVSIAIKELIYSYLVILVIFTVIMFISLNWMIIKPISRINQGLDEVAKGNLDYVLEVKSNDEIGTLSESFDNMRLGLKDRNSLLDSLLKSFTGKFGNIATILVRKNVEDLVRDNPRIEKILPASIENSIEKSRKLKEKKIITPIKENIDS